MVKMIGYIKWLASLGMIIDNDSVIDLVLYSFSNLNGTFIINYLMSEKEKSLPELLGHLRIVEQEVKKFTNVLLVVAKPNQRQG